MNFVVGRFQFGSHVFLVGRCAHVCIGCGFAALCSSLNYRHQHLPIEGWQTCVFVWGILSNAGAHL